MPPSAPTTALPKDLANEISAMLEHVAHPREKIVDIMYLLQNHYGHLSDEALQLTARFTGVSPTEVEELATFYDFIYREPVGQFVIHVCDGVTCWMHHENTIFDHLCQRLDVPPGQTTADGLFTVLPTACLGDCHNAPAMLINGKLYGQLTPDKIDSILDDLRANATTTAACKCR